MSDDRYPSVDAETLAAGETAWSDELVSRWVAECGDVATLRRWLYACCDRITDLGQTPLQRAELRRGHSFRLSDGREFTVIGVDRNVHHPALGFGGAAPVEQLTVKLQRPMRGVFVAPEDAT